MLKKCVAIAATSAAMLTGAAAMSSSAEAHPHWRHRHHWNHGWNHHGLGGVTSWYGGYGPAVHIYGGYSGVYGNTHCKVHRKWRHHHLVKVRVCGTVYW